MATDKQVLLREAPAALNQPGQPWYVTVEGDAIVTRWKWMDATFFAPHEVTSQVRDYMFTVTLKDNGKWQEKDTSTAKSGGVGFKNGQLSFGGSSSTFSGKQMGKSVQFGAGRNNQTGETGIVGFKFDTEQAKAPVRNWLTWHGWKKAGLFG